MIRSLKGAWLAAATLALMAGAVAVGSAAAPPQGTDTAALEQVRLKGWITDEWCGAGNANAKGADCARHCNENGAKLVLFSGGKLYGLSDQKLAQQHIGYQVTVQGLLSGTDKEPELAVDSIRKAKPAGKG